MKIAFYFNNINISDVNFSKPENGNPGIGGSEYQIILLATLLSQKGDKDIILLANKPSNFASSLSYSLCESSESALAYCHKEQIDVLILDAKFASVNFLKKFPSVNVILWAHNFISLETLKKYNHLKNVLRIVNVGKEQCDLYRDMQVFNKSTYIYNSVDISTVPQHFIRPFEKRPNWIVYVGSLIFAKGFHLLAEAWPKIEREISNAELFVIGSGNLYNRESKLGIWNIAEDSYEKMFMPYLTAHGKLKKNVHFLGLMGPEKFEIIGQCRVGVPNPSGCSETFGLSAVEMEMMGCNVTTIKCPGYLDTVYEKKCLYDNPSQLADYVISLLDRQCTEQNVITSFVQQNFSTRVIVQQWEKLLSSNLQINEQHIPLQANDVNYHNKKLKEIIRIYIPNCVKRFIPAIERFYPNIFIRIMKKMARKK